MSIRVARAAPSLYSAAKDEMRVETPQELPVFPLTGVLLLPGNFLPLNVFEMRYRNLVEDVMEGHRGIGMIQPRTPQPDNFGLALDSRPELYPVGCLGVIERCERQPDGRFQIVLRGVTRFRTLRELAPRRGYRRVAAAYADFADDLEQDEGGLDRSRLLAAADGFGREHGLEFDADLLRALPARSLVNALSASLPFAPVEHQALLEAATVAERQELLLTLIEMAVGPVEEPDAFDSPQVH